MKIKVSHIDANPHRDLTRNPLSEEQVAKLIDSIGRTGFWDNLVVRQHPDHSDRYQLAYGHNRLEACRRLAVEWVELPIRDLSDYDMLCCMVDENNTQQSITPRIVFENVTAALCLAEKQLNSTENVEQFNGLVKNSRLSSLKDVNIWRPNEYAKAKESISDSGDGLGVFFIKHFMPDGTVPRDETLQNAIDSYYADRRKAAALKREAEARDARAKAEEEARIRHEEARLLREQEAAALREKQEAERKEREAARQAEEATRQANEAARDAALAEQNRQQKAKQDADRNARQANEAHTRKTKDAEKKKREAKDHHDRELRERKKSERMDYAGVDRHLLEKLPTTQHMNGVVTLIKRHSIPKEHHAELIEAACGWSSDGNSTNKAGTSIAVKGAEWWDIRSGERAKRLEQSSIQARMERMRKEFGNIPFADKVFSIAEKFQAHSNSAKNDLAKCSEYFNTLSPHEAERFGKYLSSIKENCVDWMDAMIGELHESCKPVEKDITPLAPKALEYQEEVV
jgi:chemotaxis protein histidine kinase CheA